MGSFLLDQLHRDIPLVLLGLVRPLTLDVDEVASISIHAEELVTETTTFLGLVLGVDSVVFAKLVEAVCKFALLVIGATAIFHKFLAELRLKLVFPAINGLLPWH